MFSSRIQLQAAELERLIRGQGFPKAAFLRSSDLPESVSRHPQIAALGEGTFLMTALSCYREEADDLSGPGDPHGLIAPFARRNYYAEAVTRLKSVVRALHETHGFSRRDLRIFCNSPLPEKALAVASGLGSYGKNTLILIPGMGSLFVIAGLFVPVPVAGIPATGRRRSDDHAGAATAAGSGSRFPLCGDCQACQNACPVHALDEAGHLDDSLCLQALCTKELQFTEATRRAWAFRIYGCQSCQEACPYNRNLKLQTETDRGKLGPSLSLRHLLSLSPEQLKESIRGSALARSWIPPRTLLRNALLAAGNRRDPVLLQAVTSRLSDPDPLIRQAASWASARIGAAEGGEPA